MKEKSEARIDLKFDASETYDNSDPENPVLTATAMENCTAAAIILEAFRENENSIKEDALGRPLENSEKTDLVYQYNPNTAASGSFGATITIPDEEDNDRLKDKIANNLDSFDTVTLVNVSLFWKHCWTDLV